jgi:hypothetical protein
MFRQEVLESRKWKSTAVLFSSIPTWIVFSISFIIIAFFILYIFLGSYTRRENIIGEVITQSHPTIIFSNKSGHISDNYIKLNQNIKKGEPLFKITLNKTTQSGDVSQNPIRSLAN